MKKLAALIAAAVLASTLTGCTMPVRDLDETTVTFNFYTYTNAQAPMTLPVRVVYDIPGHAPWEPDPATSTPFRTTVSARQFPAVATSVTAVGRVEGPVGTIVTCDWFANTPSGTRSSDRSRGGEGHGAISDGETETTATCTYQA